MTPIQVQLQQFKALVEQNYIDKKLIQESLIFFESGSNDIFSYFYPFNPPTLTPDAYVQSMLAEVANFVDTVYKLGPRKFAIFGLGPVGCVPARAQLPGAPVSRCYGKMNKMIKDYNMGLEIMAKALPTTHSYAISVYGAIYKTFQVLNAMVIISSA